MITISQYPNESYNLVDFVNTARKSQRFSMQIIWQYNEDEALEVVVHFHSAEQRFLEQLLCAELSGMGFLYVQAPVSHIPSIKSDLRHFIFLPTQNDDSSILSSCGLNVLLSSLLQSHGRMTIDLDADLNDVRMSLSVEVDNTLLIKHAFGNCFKVSAQNNGGKAFFVATYRLQESLLQLPFQTDDNISLIKGFGSRQASVSPAVDDIFIGSVVGDVLGRKLLMSRENMTSPSMIVGGSGYGKSTLLKSLAVQGYKKYHIPFLIIEPAKDEYRELKTLVPELQVIDDMGAYSPLAFPKGMAPFMWSDIFVELITTAMNIPADSSLRAHYRDAYEKCIQNKSSIIEEFVTVTKRYSEKQIDYKENGIYMLMNFFRYFYSGSTQKEKKRFPVEDILSMPTVINLGHIPSPAMKSCFLYFIIKHIQAYLMSQKSEIIKHLLILEEAHHILGKDIAQHLLTEIVNIIREARSQGMSTIYADQSANALSEQAIAQAGNIISFRQTSLSDRESVASSLLCNADDINLLTKYTTMVRLNQMVFPARVRIDASEILNSC